MSTVIDLVRSRIEELRGRIPALRPLPIMGEKNILSNILGGGSCGLCGEVLERFPRLKSIREKGIVSTVVSVITPEKTGVSAPSVTEVQKTVESEERSRLLRR